MNWWKDHGPKITNTLTTAAVALSSINPAAVPPSWAPYIVGLNMMLNIVHNVQHNAVTESAPAQG